MRRGHWMPLPLIHTWTQRSRSVVGEYESHAASIYRLHAYEFCAAGPDGTRKTNVACRKYLQFFARHRHFIDPSTICFESMGRAVTNCFVRLLTRNKTTRSLNALIRTVKITPIYWSLIAYPSLLRASKIDPNRKRASAFLLMRRQAW